MSIRRYTAAGAAALAALAIGASTAVAHTQQVKVDTSGVHAGVADDQTAPLGGTTAPLDGLVGKDSDGDKSGLYLRVNEEDGSAQMGGCWKGAFSPGYYYAEGASSGKWSYSGWPAPKKLCPDEDKDWDDVDDRRDNCPTDKNADQKDLDQDGAGAVCDADDEDPAVQ